ncbi:MAG: OmpA family protein [Acetobacteraceae bacterium]|nr:OmpA family protein [Acetobacteraceae bacterium]
MAGAILLGLLTLAGCTAAPVQAPKSPPTAQSLDDAVDGLTVALFAHAQRDPADAAAPRVLVIDPLIDRGTGNQAVVTRAMEQRMVARVRQSVPNVEPRPFTAETLDGRPLLLTGSITAVAGPGAVPPKVDGEPTVYRIWASISDLRTGKVISKEMAWVRADQVDMTPTPFFRDSPTWAADRSMTAYLKTCSSNPGEPIDPAYLNGVKAAAATAAGIEAYENGRPLEALVSLTEAQNLPGGDQVRVHNGLYLANVALGRRAAAEQEFGRMVDAGLSQGKLAVKFVFRPASTQFWPDRAISGPYPMWLREIALHTAERGSCMRLVGHTSPTGNPELNDLLSERRARFVRANLVQRQRVLASRTEAIGRGSREPIVGTARDDASDVLDRRVELVPFGCVAVGS